MAARTKKLIAACAAAVVLLIAMAPTHAQAPRAARIVSLVPSLTETLFAIGAGPAVVGVGSFDTYPPEVTKLPKVGALIDPDVERILSLRPELVVTYGSQTELEAQLGRAKIRTFSYRHGGIRDILESFKALGEATGRTADAEALAARITSQLAAIRARVKGRARPRTLLVLDRQPGSLREIYASGGIGFMHDMLDAAGGENVFADAKSESVQPSTEMLITRAPEVIIEVRAEGLIEPSKVTAERNVWAALSSLPAVRKGRIYLLTGSQLVVPGPRLAQGTEALARALHPDAFK